MVLPLIFFFPVGFDMYAHGHAVIPPTPQTRKPGAAHAYGFSKTSL